MTKYYPDIFTEKGWLAKKANQFLPKVFEGLMFGKGKYMRTDSIPENEINETILLFEEKAKKAKNEEERIRYNALMERGESISDLTAMTYERFARNPNSMPNWFYELEKSVSDNDFFKIPKTKIWRLPMELAQYLRIEYSNTNQQSRDFFNEICFDKFELDDDKTYFVKTGTFSSKFEFRNTHCKEPREIGEYFSVINNFAMTVGAGRSIDIVVREWIEDEEKRPTIYNGMPLRTEFRSFIDCDKNEVIGIVPYWNPLVMKKKLKIQGQDNEEIYEDYKTYLKMENVLNKEFNDNVSAVKKNIEAILPKLKLKGKWSLDVMKNGNDFYLIDMATMETSALTELL